MKNQNLRMVVIVLIIILTTVLVGGGVFFLQQSSIKELKKEVQNLQKNTTSRAVTDRQTISSKTTDAEDDIKNLKTKKDSLSLPIGVEWLTYTDNDLSFIYPKTFLGTPLQESSDQNLARKKWEVLREDDTIYIRPNFESPVAEFGSTYEIQIIRDLKEAKELFHSILFTGSSKNLCSHSIPIQIPGYTACSFERKVDMGLGRIGIYYVIMPNTKSGSKILPWVYVFDMSGGAYHDYVESVLLPSIDIK